MDPAHDRGSMDLVHISVDPVYGGVHGPGIHVLYFPPKYCSLLNVKFPNKGNQMKET